MADSGVIQKVQGSETDILSIINENFKVLTQRIKDMNLQISYLDLLKVNNIYTVNGGEDDTDDQRVRLFISQCWNLLANYNGVYVNGGPSINIGTESGLFTWKGSIVQNGAFIVKLPGNESLVIPPAKATAYRPYTYNGATGTIEYEMVSASSASPASIPTPVINPVNHGSIIATYTVASHESFSAAGSIQAIYWYTTDTKEQVIMPAPLSTENLTDRTLQAIVLQDYSSL